MMKIGIISDTHYNNAYISKVVCYLRETECVKAVYHLGDEWDDAAAVEREGLPVIKVPGIFAEQYKNPSIPNQIVETIGSARIIITHDINDLTADDIANNDVVLFGHTHNHELKSTPGKIFLNPGHLKEKYHKDRIASFAVIKFGQNKIKAKILDIDFNLVAKMTVYHQ